MATKYVTQKEILEGIKSLSHSQGFYTHLWGHMQEDRTILPKLHTFARKQGCKDFVDFVIALEQ